IGTCRRSLALHQEGVELVAVGIAEIAGIEAAPTVARRTFALAAIGKRNVVQPLHLSFVAGLECDHHAIADARRTAVKRPGDANARAASGLAPGDELFVVHHPPDAELAAQSIVELGRLLTVVGAERHIADHLMSSCR